MRPFPPAVFISLARAVLLLFAAGVAAEVHAATAPNIVLIFSDDHASQAISAYGNSRRLVETPNLDRLAAQGMLFERCLVPNPICGPSRASVLTGKYSHRNGYYRNGATFDASQATFPQLLQRAGYQTALVGKWHLFSEPKGFNYWEVLPGQGAYYNPEFNRMDGTTIKREGYVTDLITDLSLDWLRRRDRTKPFLLMAHHKAAHSVYMPALRHLDWSGDRRFAEPSTLFDDYAGRGKAEREQDMRLDGVLTDRIFKLAEAEPLAPSQRRVWDDWYEPRNAAFRAASLTGTDLARWKYQRLMHDYLGCVLAIDESVGRLMQFLNTEGLSDNTIVVYASDQGFFLGEHGWIDKRWIYEESLATPFIVRWPGTAQAGRRNRDLVSLLDVAETFLDAAGLPIPTDMQGRSLVPVLRGQTPGDWRKSFYYHYYEFAENAHCVHRHYGVVTDRYKLFHFYEPALNYWTLMDLEKDPGEMQNVYGDARYAGVQRELHAELARLRRELGVPLVDPPESNSPPPGEWWRTHEEEAFRARRKALVGTVAPARPSPRSAPAATPKP